VFHVKHQLNTNIQLDVEPAFHMYLLQVPCTHDQLLCLRTILAASSKLAAFGRDERAAAMAALDAIDAMMETESF
jgi:hypothetical protein